MIGEDAVEVVRNDDGHRYEAWLDGRVVAFVRFRAQPGTIVLIHTETEPAYGGRGIASALARGALEDIRARGERAVARCPFIAGYVQRNPDYADLLIPG